MTENINSENVILIGMPGAGKSTCGVLAAKLLLKNFFDTDLLIQSRERKRLQQIIDESGLAYFKKAEEEAILSLDIAGAVIATGGSVVYSDAAMCHLKKTGKVIYLHLSFEEMQNHINNLSSRGIALENGETLRDMYDKRLPLYEKYADAVVDCCGNSIETTVEKIIAAQQEIKASLYLMLLQKREENAITLAATANNGRMVEEPLAGGMVGPNGKTYYMLAFLLGLGIPVAIIFLRNLLRFKIESRADVEKITDVPVVGDIPLTDTEGHPIVVQENRNGLMEEVFRSVRTNLQYMLGEGQKVILFTSTTSGEGKSFNAGNLACSFAFMGKKVVIVGLDIRKPGLNKVFEISHKERGITQYLADPKHTDLLSLCQPSAISPNLFILPGGTVPPNPTELVARKTLDEAIDQHQPQ